MNIWYKNWNWKNIIINNIIKLKIKIKNIFKKKRLKY